jgi:hypothetical protein
MESTGMEYRVPWKDAIDVLCRLERNWTVAD